MSTVKLTQYIMPDGRRREVETEVNDETVKRAEGMKLSCEVLNTSMVALYAKYPTDKPEDEFIEISPNNEKITEFLELLIERKWKEGKHEETNRQTN